MVQCRAELGGDGGSSEGVGVGREIVDDDERLRLAPDAVDGDVAHRDFQ